jgi:hypothetical protein
MHGHGVLHWVENGWLRDVSGVFHDAWTFSKDDSSLALRGAHVAAVIGHANVQIARPSNT